MKKIFLCLIFFVLSAAASEAATPQLVNQPAYDNMNFYVYKPNNIPREFFVTYDGFIVYKDSKGIWYYGSAENSGIIKTAYVVGSVVPSVVNLKPYDAKLSNVAPLLEKPITPAGKKLPPSSYAPPKAAQAPLPVPYPYGNPGGINYYPPATEIYVPDNLSPYAEDWTQNSNFMAVRNWKGTVDRMGVLYRPRIPVAWKGECPEVIYAWTGLQWRQINARNKSDKAVTTLRREAYGLTVHVNRLNLLNWNDRDSYILSQYSMMWGYQWLGQIVIMTDY